MLFLDLLKKKRWSRIQCDSGESYYRLRLGSKGKGGCKVIKLSLSEEKAIIEWFLEHSVKLSDSCVGSLWWNHRPFGYWYNVMDNDDELMYHGGTEFRMSVEAYNVFHNN